MKLSKFIDNIFESVETSFVLTLIYAIFWTGVIIGGTIYVVENPTANTLYVIGARVVYAGVTGR